jgi:hypothetical protein
MKRSFDTVTKLFLANFQNNKQHIQFTFEYFDKLLIWIVGFSIGGLSIIVTNLTEFNNTFDEQIIKLSLFFFVISIVSGVLFKLLYYFYQMEYLKIERFLEYSFIFAKDIVDEIVEDRNIYFYVKILKEGLGIDSSE